MKTSTEEIMEGLTKYVPFIDFVLEIDPIKYIKFINIRKWILLKKKNYPLSDLNKIEQSIITQYKNLLLEKKVLIPQNITNIFAPTVPKQFINLCSDDEESEMGNPVINKAKNNKRVYERKKRHSHTKRKHSEPKTDDDLEFVSIDYVIKKKEEENEEQAIDEISQDILSKIDKLTADDIKRKNSVPEPINYTYKIENEEHSDTPDGEEFIYERRANASDVLFKRRTDFKDEVQVENLVNERELELFAKGPIDTISLDSQSESEGCKEDGPSSSKNAAASLREKSTEERAISTSEEIEKIAANTDSNTSGSNSANRRVELLCNSIDSVLPDTYYLMRELEDLNNASTKEGGSDKENSVNPPPENDPPTAKNYPSLTPEQISRILEDISSKTDFEWDIFYEALLHVWQINSDKEAVSETPPPAPPAIDTSVPPPNMQPCFPPEQQAPLAPTFTSHYNPNQNLFPMGMMPRRPKVNINDPRIKKQLQVIQNSPLFKYNVLSTDLEQSIRNISQAQAIQQPQPQTQPQPQIRPSNIVNSNSSLNNFNSSTATHKAPISYGEYKRRQQEKKLEMERQREEERKAKVREEELERQRLQLELCKMREEERKAKAREEELERQRLQLELRKMREEENSRYKLLNNINPCKEQLTTLYSQQRNNTTTCRENTSRNLEQQQDNNCGQEPDAERGINKSVTITKDGGGKQAITEHKLNRVYNELRCTVKGFDQIQDFILEDNLDTANENRRRNSYVSSDVDSNDATKRSTTPKHIGLRRRSSIHALSAISEQLAQQSSGSEPEFDPKNKSKRRVINSSENSAGVESVPRTPKRRRTMDSVVRPTSRANALRIIDDDTSSSDDECVSIITRQNFVIKQPIIKLRRISENFIRKHTKSIEEDDILPQNHLPAEQNFKVKKTYEIVKNIKEPVQKTTKVKKLNNDCQMTERSTSFCALCRSKPSDLTNHYIGRHKTESYVSRLSWSELEDLAVNTPFAKLQPQSKTFRFQRYEVQCPFCEEMLLDQFINLYNHYSAHTGEYAFRCSHCHLTKPYKPDIQSHILHSKTCRNSSIQVMYRYPPQALCIYLHYCTICNFVQLNEANVLKHLREHHDHSKAVANNVQKCILAAVSDGLDTNQTIESSSPPPIPASPTIIPAQEVAAAACTPSTHYSVDEIKQTEINTSTVNELKFKVDDDDIPVSNEPCLEDEFLDEDRYPLEQKLKQMHEGPTSTNNAAPYMTVIHTIPESKIPDFNPSLEQRHLPIQIKAEGTDVDKTNKKSSNRNAKHPHLQVLRWESVVYERYRSYPPNVNYLGLYKCMIDDCFYSTDCSEEIVKHLTEHSSYEIKQNEYLQCPYCIITLDKKITPAQLIEHVRTEHAHLNFQCSMCCYRSYTASNVRLHQQMLHNSVLDMCKIYKCSSIEKSPHNFHLEKQVSNFVFKILCKVCNAGFYYTKHLQHHLHNAHNVKLNFSINIYSCIYCPLMVQSKNEIKNHLATKHPGEHPLVFDHNKQIDQGAEDTRSINHVFDISELVQWTEVTPTVRADTQEEHSLQDIKPEFKELVRMNEETVKVRLQKLTAHTGVPPDCLYRCPEEICGGFFSNFELWLRHMKERHYVLECKCPHCPMTTLMLPLQQFALHFELHRRHTFICFYCSATFSTEALLTFHAGEQHSCFNSMRLEKIRFNLSYSYSIIIQSELFQEREKFLAELLLITDNRLKELEKIRMTNLRQQWPVEHNNPWIDDYLQMFSKRKLALRCLVKDCDFRTCKEEILYRHLSTMHTITGTQFKCSKCDYQVEKCNNLDELFNHIKLHNEYIFVCVACSEITSSRPRMSAHIAAKHSARDVPVIHLFRSNGQMFIKIYIVFSDNHISFSTMKNCFCCSEQNMGGDVFSLHLKHYHKLSLNYYCEKCTNFSFKSLKEVRPHFEQFHSTNTFKICCELAGHDNLNVTSLNDFQVQISTTDSVSRYVKNEPLEGPDSDVILIEDNDVEIENFVREEQPKQVKVPQLKCASLNKLIDPTACPWAVPAMQSTAPLLPSPQLSLINPNLNQFTSAAAVDLSRPQLPVMDQNFNQFTSTAAVNQTQPQLPITNQNFNQFTSTATMGQTQPQRPVINSNLNQFISTAAVGQNQAHFAIMNQNSNQFTSTAATGQTQHQLPVMNPNLNQFTSTAAMGQNQPHLSIINQNSNQFSSTVTVGQTQHQLPAMNQNLNQFTSSATVGQTQRQLPVMNPNINQFTSTATMGQNQQQLPIINQNINQFTSTADVDQTQPQVAGMSRTLANSARQMMWAQPGPSFQ